MIYPVETVPCSTALTNLTCHKPCCATLQLCGGGGEGQSVFWNAGKRLLAGYLPQGECCMYKVSQYPEFKIYRLAASPFRIQALKALAFGGLHFRIVKD